MLTRVRLPIAKAEEAFMTTATPDLFDFDRVIDRQATNSIKWDAYPDALPMWVADMDFTAPPAVIEALHARVAHGVFGYQMDAPGLRAVLCERMAHLYGWTVTPDQLLFLPGLVSALFLAARVLSEPGEGVLIQTPVYPPFHYAPLHYGRPLHTADLLATSQPDGTLHYEIDFDAFEAVITPDTKVFFLCNPHNPTGRVLTPDELARLADICARHDLLIVSDEIHCDLLLDDLTHTPIAALTPEISARTVTLMAPSKTFNLAGLGCSFAIIQDEALRKRVQAQLWGPMPHVNNLGLTAAEAAYAHGEDWLRALLAYLRGNRDTVVDFVQAHLPGVRVTRPQATYLSWLDFRALGLPDDDAYRFCLEQARVALNDGKTFGASGVGYARLNFGTSRATLLDGLERLRTALAAR